MSTQTLRHLCDAMDALAAARAATLDGMLEDTIEAAQAKVIVSMEDAVAAFDVESSAVDQESWRGGYEAALDDVAVASDTSDEPRDDLYDAICGLFEAGAISRFVFNTLICASEDGGKPAVIAAADNLRASRGTDAATHLAIMAAVQ